jgi:hypothetical protein
MCAVLGAEEVQVLHGALWKKLIRLGLIPLFALAAGPNLQCRAGIRLPCHAAPETGWVLPVCGSRDRMFVPNRSASWWTMKAASMLQDSSCLQGLDQYGLQLSRMRKISPLNLPTT